MEENSSNQIPALEARQVFKSFAGVPVLKGVDLVVERGEIHGLIGPNGSGKSTLVKILAGFHRPDGKPLIRVNGRELVPPFSAAEVRRVGMGFVHQDLALIGDCSAADNLGFSAAGFAHARAGRIAWRRHFRRARELFERVGLEIDPRTLVKDLAPAERTLVAIARALNEFTDEALLVLDEPTASLPQREVERLFNSLKRLAAEGTALVYISHRLPELIALTDRVTVMRDGRVIASRQTSELTHDQLAELMLGEVETRRVEPLDDGGGADGERQVLRMRGVATEAMHPVDLAVNEGEILVLTGSVGCGAAEVGRALSGLAPVQSGSIEVNGEPYAPGPAAKQSGLAYLPADRQGQASFQELTLAENLLAADWGGFARKGKLANRAARREVVARIAELQVEPPEPDRVFRTLSGGNQQKVLIAKWLRLNPRVLVVDEPTQGIDIRTRGEIYARLRTEAANGLAIVWITSDFEEAAVIGDRIMVFVQGRHETTLAGGDATPDLIARRSLLGTVAAA